MQGATANPEEWTFAPDEMEMVRISSADELQPVKRRDVSKLLSHRLFVTGWNEWSRFKRFGLPHGGLGYKRERGPVIWVIEILEQELEAFQADSMERKNG